MPLSSTLCLFFSSFNVYSGCVLGWTDYSALFICLQSRFKIILAHAQYYDCLRDCFLNMHQLIWGQHYWVLSQSPWAPINNHLAAKRILFMIIFLLPQLSKQKFEQLVLHNPKLWGKMSSWIMFLACTCRGGGGGCVLRIILQIQEPIISSL